MNVYKIQYHSYNKIPSFYGNHFSSFQITIKETNV